jgi:tRNA A-37 threonylcarbamoyl transferase component Bud32
MTSPGEVLNGRYRLERPLGGGRMGTVWKAFDTDLERTVAVKELAPGPFSDEDAATRRERVRREAIALAQVEHPVVVTVHDLISVGRDKAPWIVMGYVPGRPLSELIKERKNKPLSERKIASIALAVLDGLRACHSSDPRVYHRDVKPGNIVVGPDGSVHLVDFGIARIVGKASLTDDRLIGTPGFLAPELLDGEPPGPGTDLWALGVTLYYALTGELPFEAETVMAVLTAIKFKNLPEPRDGGPLANLVLQMLRKRPEDRPDVGTIAAILRGVASQPDRPGGQSYWTGPQPSTEQHGGDWPTQARSPRQVTGTRPGRAESRLSALSGLPVLTQAQVVAGMPTDQAAAELLALSRKDAARIINRCDYPLAGNLLSAIAITGDPSADDRDASELAAAVRKILQMLSPDRHGPLLDHMSSIALAAVLAAPPVEETASIVDQADTATVVGALSEMTPVRAALLVAAMDAGRATEVLKRTGPARVADILRNVSSAGRRQELLSRLPERSRASVLRYLDG